MDSFEKINIEDIIPANYNPRQISNADYNKLSKSINEFGVISPIIINLKNNHIIGGNQRWGAIYDEYINDGSYEELNLIRVGDIGWAFPSTDLKVKDLSTEKAMNLALNKISGEWDIPKLENLLIDLDVDDYDLDLTGFDNMDLQEFNIDLKTNITLPSPQEQLKNTLEKEKNTNTVKDKTDSNETNVKVTVYDGNETDKKDNNNDDGEGIPDSEPVFDESIADTIPTIKCPKCGYEIPK